MAPEVRSVLLDAVESAGFRRFELASGAGHDAVSLAHVTNVGMVFSRCRDGVSHNPAEFVCADDVAAVVEVIEQLLLNPDAAAIGCA